MSQQNVYEMRRERLRELIRVHGGPKQIGLKAGYTNASFIVQMAGPNPTREVTEQTARRIEAAYKLPHGWLDGEGPGLSVPATPVLTPAGFAAPQITPSQNFRPVAINGPLLAQIVTTLATGGVPPAKIGDATALAYADAVANGDTLRSEFVDQLLRLMR